MIPVNVPVGSRVSPNPIVELNPNLSSHSSPLLDPMGSISKASPPARVLTDIDRPYLPPPASLDKELTVSVQPTLSELRFLQAMGVLRSYGDQILETLGLRLQIFRLHLEEITSENIEQLKKAAETAKSADVWSLLKKIATALISALSVLVGFSIVSTGAGVLVGGAMIGWGLLSIANMILTESGTWDYVAKQLAGQDEEKRRLFALFLPGTIGILSSCVGIFGSAGAFAWSGVNFFQKLIAILQLTTAIFDGATTVGKGYSDAQLIKSEAALTETKSKMVIEKQRIDMTAQSIEHVLSGLKAAHEQSSSFVKMAIRSNEAVVKKRFA